MEAEDLRSPPPYHNLDNQIQEATTEPLIGRGAWVTRVEDDLSRDETNTIVAIEGIIGIGKSAIARAVARDYIERYAHPPGGRGFNAIIYVSAKMWEWAPDGPRSLRLAPIILRDIYDAIAQVARKKDGAPIKLVEDPDADRQTMRAAILDMGRVLFVLDDLDDPDDRFTSGDGFDSSSTSWADSLLEQIADLLGRNDALQGPANKLLVTMRKDRAAVQVRIRPPALDDESMLAYIKQIAEARGVTLSESDQCRLASAAWGLPLGGRLAIELVQAAAPTTRSEFDQVVAQLKERFFDPTVGALLRRMARRHRQNYQALVALAFFDPNTGATRDQLGTILDAVRPIKSEELASDRARNLLEPLWPLNLAFGVTELPEIEPNEVRYIMPATIQRYLDYEEEHATERGRDAQREGMRDRWIDWYLGYVRNYGGRDRSNWAVRFDPLAAEWPNLQRVFAWCRKHRCYTELRRFWRLYDGVDSFADLYGHWGERLVSLLWLGIEAERREDWRTALTAFSNAGWVRSHQGDPFQAYGLLQRAVENCQRGNLWNAQERLELLENLVEYFIRKGDHEADPDEVARNAAQARDYARARDYLGQHQALAERLYGETISDKSAYTAQRAEANGYYYLGMVQERAGNWGQAWHWFLRAGRKGQAYKYERASLYALNWLVDIALATGRIQTARWMILLVERVAMANNDIRRMAYVALSRARLALASQDVAVARESCENAISGFTRLGMRQEALEAQRMLEQLAPGP